MAGPVDERQPEYISEAAAQELMPSGTRQVNYAKRSVWMGEQRWGSACSTSLGMGVDGDFESVKNLDLEQAGCT